MHQVKALSDKQMELWQATVQIQEETTALYTLYEEYEELESKLMAVQKKIDVAEKSVSTDSLEIFKKFQTKWKLQGTE